MRFRISGFLSSSLYRQGLFFQRSANEITIFRETNYLWAGIYNYLFSVKNEVSRPYSLVAKSDSVRVEKGVETPNIGSCHDGLELLWGVIIIKLAILQNLLVKPICHNDQRKTLCLDVSLKLRYFRGAEKIFRVDNQEGCVVACVEAGEGIRQSFDVEASILSESLMQLHVIGE